MIGTPDYLPINTFAWGGTISGGTVVDELRVVSPSSTAQQSSIGTSISDERGLHPRVRHYLITNFGNSDAHFIFRMFWEERD